MDAFYKFGVGGLKHPGYNDPGTIAAGVSAGSSLLGGMMGDDAAGDSASASNAGLLKAIQELRATDDRTRSDTAPYRALGSGASNKLAQMLGINVYDPANGGFGGYGSGDLVKVDGSGELVRNEQLASLSPEYARAWDEFVQVHQNKYGTSANTNKGSNVSDVQKFLQSRVNLDDVNNKLKENAAAFTSDPTYGSLLKKFSQDDLNKDVVYNTGLQFGLDEGTKALNNRARASGGTDSGSVLKALTRYGNDYATTKAGDAYNRYTGEQTNNYNMLSGATNIGQNAVNTSANTGTAIGSAIAGAQNSIGQNNAAARMGSANAWGSALGGISNAAQNYSLMNILKGL